MQAQAEAAVEVEEDARETLLRDPESWARARAAGVAPTQLDGVDLRGADLSGLDLTEVSLKGARLDAASLENTQLGGARLQGASLRGVRAVCADLFRADLSGADLTGANFSAATLRQTILDGVVAQGVGFAGADLSEARLHEAVLSGADLGGAFAPGAQFDGADLRQTKLTFAEIDCPYARAWRAGDGLAAFEAHHGHAPDETVAPTPSTGPVPVQPAVDVGAARGYFEELVAQLEASERRGQEQAEALREARAALALSEGAGLKRLSDVRRTLYARLDREVEQARVEGLAATAEAEAALALARTRAAQAEADRALLQEAFEAQRESVQIEASTMARIELLEERLADADGQSKRTARTMEGAQIRVAAITAERDASVAMLERQLRVAVEKAEAAHDRAAETREELAEAEAREQARIETLTARLEAVHADHREARAEAARHARAMMTAASASTLKESAGVFRHQGLLSGVQAAGLVTLGAGITLSLLSLHSSLALHGVASFIVAGGMAAWYVGRRGESKVAQREEDGATVRVPQTGNPRKAGGRAPLGVWNRAFRG